MAKFTELKSFAKKLFDDDNFRGRVLALNSICDDIDYPAYHYAADDDPIHVEGYMLTYEQYCTLTNIDIERLLLEISNQRKLASTWAAWKAKNRTIAIKGTAVALAACGRGYLTSRTTLTIDPATRNVTYQTGNTIDGALDAIYDSVSAGSVSNAVAALKAEFQALAAGHPTRELTIRWAMLSKLVAEF